MRAPCVRRARDAVVVENDSIWRAGLNYLSIQTLAVFPATKLRDAIGTAIDAFRRHVRVQLEGPPGNVQPDIFAKLLCQIGCGAYEAALADQAPRADKIRSDRNRNIGHRPITERRAHRPGGPKSPPLPPSPGSSDE